MRNKKSFFVLILALVLSPSFISGACSQPAPDLATVSSQSPKELYLTGSQFVANSQPEKAIAYFEKALKLTSDPEERLVLLTMLSGCHLTMGVLPYLEKKDETNYKKALEYAHQVLKIKPEFGPIFGTMGIIKLNMAEYKDAEFYFSQVKRFSGENSEEYKFLAPSHALAKQKLEEKK